MQAQQRNGSMTLTNVNTRAKRKDKGAAPHSFGEAQLLQIGKALRDRRFVAQLKHQVGL